MTKTFALAILLVFFSSTETVKAQQIKTVISEHIKFTSSAFQEGTYISVRIIFPKDREKMDVRFTFPEGIEYAGYTLEKNSAIRKVIPKEKNSPNSPILTVLSRPGATIHLLVKRKITKKGYDTLKMRLPLQDEVSAIVDEVTVATKKSNDYFLNVPNLIVLPQKVKENPQGGYLRVFSIENKNTAGKRVGIINDIYFSVKHPLGIKTRKMIYNKKVLTPVGKVPEHIGQNGGEDLYMIRISEGLKEKGGVLITEEYTAKGCEANGEVTYEAYWGENTLKLYEVSSAVQSVTMEVASDEKPDVVLNPQSTATYFKWDDGFCGNTLGMFTAQYINKGNATAYNLQLTLYEEEEKYKLYKPTNFRIIDYKGKELTIPESVIQMPEGALGKHIINFAELENFNDLGLGETDMGLTDEDGDGIRDDLAPEGKLNIRFDLVKDDTIPCISSTKGVFSVNPITELTYRSLCGDSFHKQERLNDYTFKRKVKGVEDTSQFPTLLPLNQPTSASISFTASITSADNIQQLQSHRREIARRKYFYELSLPEGVAMKNVRFYKNRTSVAPVIVLPAVSSGGTFSYTTADEVEGYITFDLVLTTCKANKVSLQYSVGQMDKDRYNTYCKIPYICERKIIATECPDICFKNAPKTLSTTIERADNSYGWTDYTMAERQKRGKISGEDWKRVLLLDDIEVISEGVQLGETSKNLYYCVRVPKTVTLLPKQISLKVGEHAITLVAKQGVLSQTTDNENNYFLWNLTEALPSEGVWANERFTAVATYQVKSCTAEDVTSVTELKEEIHSFFYRLDNTKEQAISEKGYHTGALHCGKESKNVFYIVNIPDRVVRATYKLKDCVLFTLRSTAVIDTLQSATVAIFKDEYRPKRLVQTIEIKVPKGYDLVKPVAYYYLENTVTNVVYIPLNSFTTAEDKDFKVYTYANPKKGMEGYLPPEIISVQNNENQYIEVFVQPTCKAKVSTSEGEAFDHHQLVTIEVSYEDAYYHYANSGERKIRCENSTYTLLYAGQRSVTLQSITPEHIKIDSETFFIDFRVGNLNEEAVTNVHLIVPEIEGIEVVRLLEIDSITQEIQKVISARDIQGKKYYSLSELQAHTDKVYRLEYRVTNCDMTHFVVKVYAGRGCGDSLMECHRHQLVYNVEIEKEATPNIVIEEQPESQALCSGERAVFTSVAKLSSASAIEKTISYQWQELTGKNIQWKDIDTEKGTVASGDKVMLLLNSVSRDLNGNKYRVKYSYTAVETTTVHYSEEAILRVNYLTIAQQPTSAVYIQNTLPSPLYVEMKGRTTPVYQWYENTTNTNVGGRTVGSHTNSYIPSTEAVGERYYYVTITGKCGTVTSSVAKIEVKADSFSPMNKLKGITVYNGISANGDGKDDYFYIEGIEYYPNNRVRIYNRGGEKIFDIEGYNNASRIFRGAGNIPLGTYYYIIEYYDRFEQKQTKVGCLYIQK
ncbi:gliding motility-associated C-terminal domain-containing protein [Capnocytophaga sp. HP1101]